MVLLALCSMVGTPSAGHGAMPAGIQGPSSDLLCPAPSFRANYVFTRELIPLSVCFPSASTLPGKATRGRSEPGGTPRAGDPLASCGCR